MSCNWQLGGKVILYNKFYDANKFLVYLTTEKQSLVIAEEAANTVLLKHYHFMHRPIVQHPW